MSSAKSIRAFNTSIFDRVLESGTPQEKHRLAEQLSRLACDENTKQLERDAIVPTLLRLTTDPVRGVRVLLAKLLAQSKSLHPDIVFSIVADDADISLPFLAETQALDPYSMMAILKVGDKARQMVVVSRSDIARDCIDYVCDRGESDVCAQLLDNEEIEVRTHNYRRLYVRFRDIPEVMDRLLERKDLPLEVRILQAKRASGRCHQLMAERGWMGANDAEEIIADTQETTMLRILAGARNGELGGLVRFLSTKGLLTPSMVLRSACNGDMAVVAEALAYLSSTSPVKMQRLVADRSVGGLRSAYKKAGLPRTYFHIIRACVDAAGDLAEASSSVRKQQFGPKLVEYLVTRYTSISADEKSACLDVISRLGDDNTRNLARSLVSQLGLAA